MSGCRRSGWHRWRKSGFKSRDGTEIHGFMVKPTDYRPGQRYPTVLRIHGGPVWQFYNDFANFDWQLLAANGYVVVAANPRGSSGRGEKFSTAIWADWGNKDGQDVLAAVDFAVAQGVADPERLGVGGWSYGGILTDQVIARDQRFKAAISGAGHRQCSRRLRHRSVCARIRGGAGHPLAEHRSLAQGLVPLPPCRPHRNPDAFPLRGEGLQRAPAQLRADVPGTEESGTGDPAGDLSGGVP